MEKTYTLNVYNTLTGQYETVSVSENIYRIVKRSQWNIRDNQRKFYKHEIQMSALLGGDEEAYLNFREFIDEVETPENISIRKETSRIIRMVLNCLTPSMKKRVILRYIEGLTIKQISEREGVSEDSIKESLDHAKKKIRKNLKKFLEIPP